MPYSLATKPFVEKYLEQEEGENEWGQAPMLEICVHLTVSGREDRKLPEGRM